MKVARERVIGALIDDWVTSAHCGRRFAEKMARGGFKGFDAMTNAELCQHYSDAILLGYGEEIEALMEDPEYRDGDGGWIHWSGGKCPVDPDTPVEYQMRAETKFLDYAAYQERAGDLIWEHDESLISRCAWITAYRVVG